MPVSIRSVLGATKLVFDSIGGMTRMVEQMHGTIAARPSPLSSPPHTTVRAPGRAGAVYSTLETVIQRLGEAVDRSAVELLEMLPEQEPSQTEAKILAALNGVCGDYLESGGNPLALSMGFSTPHQSLPLTQEGIQRVLPDATPHVVVLVHGLCLSEHAWSRRGSPSIGQRLHEAHGTTPVYLRYNSGRRISSNGRELAQKLEQLVRAWPMPVESLALVGHSMGGLVIRSACFYGQKEGQRWLESLRRVACLGTPHHGAPLEKLGHRLTSWMTRSPYVNPLALGARRSAGIKDLRHGNLLDEDWQGRDPDVAHPDQRQVVALLPGVEYYFVASTVGHDENDVRGHVLGDLLVRPGSAVGSHSEEERRIRAQPENCRVFHGLNHFDLLDHPSVHEQLVAWFGRSHPAASDAAKPAPRSATPGTQAE